MKRMGIVGQVSIIRGGNPVVIAQEIVDDLEAALEQFRLIANDLGGESSENTTS